MRTQVAVCPGCGRPVKIDLKTRSGICEYCGNQVFWTRDDVMDTDIVQNNASLAVKYFKEKDFNSANVYAQNILSYVPDSAIGLFITAFWRSFITESRTPRAVYDFFAAGASDTASVNEIRQVLILTRLALSYLVDSEGKIIEYASSSADDATAQTFLDSFLSESVTRRGNSEWLNDEKTAVYIRLVQCYNLPKTMFSLYKSISDNNDSPISTGNYGIISSVKDFIDRYCGNVEKIFTNIKDENLRTKFISALKTVVKGLTNAYQAQVEKMRLFKEKVGF